MGPKIKSTSQTKHTKVFVKFTLLIILWFAVSSIKLFNSVDISADLTGNIIIVKQITIISAGILPVMNQFLY